MSRRSNAEKEGTPVCFEGTNDAVSLKRNGGEVFCRRSSATARALVSLLVSWFRLAGLDTARILAIYGGLDMLDALDPP
ncbi:MAG: hypothetical protein CBD18_00405 [Opitutales bacterium TMED158]|nr:MAG: hypothetical protein CBD18_00405 [Opitutales bacterium TMED158]